MKLEDAPRKGWYPDPQGGARLRWWDGADWSDRWRAPPTPGVIEIKTQWEEEHGDRGDQYADPQAYRMGSLSRADSEAIVNQVRMAARQEAERAAQMFGAQARHATSQIGPLISQYTSKFLKWFRIAAIIVISLAVLWLAFQIFAQISFFEWLGDRIDNITDNDGMLVGLRAG